MGGCSTGCRGDSKALQNAQKRLGEDGFAVWGRVPARSDRLHRRRSVELCEHGGMNMDKTGVTGGVCSKMAENRAFSCDIGDVSRVWAITFLS